MRLELLRLAVSVSLLLTSGIAQAQPVPALDIAQLTREADVIVVGSLTITAERAGSIASSNGQRIGGTVYDGFIAADQVVKGPSSLSAIQIEFFDPSVSIGYQRPNDGDYRLFLLKGLAAPYVFVSPYYPSLPAVSGTSFKRNDPLGRVFETLATVVSGGRASVQLRREVVSELWFVKDETILSALRGVLDDRDDVVRLTAAAILLRANDVSALPVAEEALLSRGAPLPPGLALSLTSAMTYVSDPAAVPGLTRLFSGGDPDTKRAAVEALGHTHSEAAIQPLIAALDDGDVTVRYTAARSLALLTGQMEWGPGMREFQRNEQQVVQHWKDWAANR